MKMKMIYRIVGGKRINQEENYLIFIVFKFLIKSISINLESFRMNPYTINGAGLFLRNFELTQQQELFMKIPKQGNTQN